MMQLTPDLGAKLGKLLPRLASDAPGEVVATVQAIRRTLARDGLDLHDLAARLITPPVAVKPKVDPGGFAGGDLFQMARSLRDHAFHRLSANQRDFILKATSILAAGRALTPKQEKWLRDLHAKNVGH